MSQNGALNQEVTWTSDFIFGVSGKKRSQNQKWRPYHEIERTELE